MVREFGKVTRISAIMAVLVALVMLASPVLQIGGKSAGPVGNAAAANGSRVINVGIVDLTGSVSTLNPFTYTMSSEFDIIWPCYSTLLTYDINANRVGDLATSYSLAPDGVTWNFKLARNAYFIDPAAPTSTAHQVTATDVMWTYNEINTDAKNHLSSYFLTGSVGIIQSMWTGVDNWDLYIRTTGPYAPFLGALTSIPIVPEYIWGHLTNGKTPTTYNNEPIVGSGAFYTQVTTPLSGIAIMKRNTIWFQEANKGWQLHVDTLQYKSESSTANAWTDLTTNPPLIDVYLNVAPPQYKNNIIDNPTPGILGWAQSTGFVYEYQLNQLSLAQRAAYGMHSGSNSQLLLNPTVRLAMAMCVNKTDFISQVVMGLGSVADSLVPDCNPWHYTYPNPVQYNPVAARALLMSAGWAYDSLGNPATSTTFPLYQKGTSNNTVYWGLNFRMLTLTTNAEWTMGSNLLASWAALGGVKLTVQPVSTNQANSAWYAGDYDTWLWDWVFSPTSDPSTDCLQVDTTMAIGTWSGSYWSNATFDALYNRSLVAMDPTARRQLTNQMQAMIYEDHNDQLVAYTKYLYAASTYNWYGPSYGDWAAHWTLMPDSGYVWLYMQLSPNDNHAPSVTVGQSQFSGYTGSPGISVYGDGQDGSTLKYQWYWGDGTSTGWQTSASQTHIYTKDGNYTAYLAAQEQGTADGFISWAPANIVAVDASNRAPTISSIGVSPSTILEGTVVTFVATANDLDGDPLTYSWNFGDTYTGSGQTVTHAFTTAGTYTVVLSVDDGHVGPGRPATLSQQVSIQVNHPPVVSIRSYQFSIWKVPTWFNATGSDSDGTPLRYTWNWDDGSKSVTTTGLNVTHTFNQKATFNVRVYVDDLSGLAGHNVSALDQLTVGQTRTPPVPLSLSVNKTTTWATQPVLFTASAQDSAGDGLHFSINCGDGTYVNVDTPPSAANQVITVTLSHTYNSPGTMTARLYVNDGADNKTYATPVTVTVNWNNLPSITPMATKYMNSGTSTSFAVTAFDADGETLRYTWNFGDGTALQAGASTTHTYAKAGLFTFTVYVNDLTGITGHNVSASATAKSAFNLPLAVGWNFVSVPVTGYNYKASNLTGLVVGDMISSWNPTTQKYDKTYIKGISPSTADFTLQQHTGYWIWVAGVKTLHLYGMAPTASQTYTFTIPLAGGWVAVGLESQKTTWKAANLPSMYTGTGALTMVAFFNTATGKYSSWVSVAPALNNFLIVPGVCYWVWITLGTGGTLTYIP